MHTRSPKSVHKPHDDTGRAGRRQQVCLPQVTVEIDISRIKTLGRRRSINQEKVDALAESIKARGLQYPIDVGLIIKGMFRGYYNLIAGAHRLAALKQLGITKIPARILSHEQKVAWQELENLLHTEFPVLERAEAIDKTHRKVRKRRAASKLGGAQPHDKGISELARVTGFSRKVVGEALRIASIPESLRDRIRGHRRLADNSVQLIKIANSDPDGQLRLVDQLLLPPTETKQKAKRSDASAVRSSYKAQVERLTLAWSKCDFKNVFDKEEKSARVAFLRKLLAA